MKLLAAFTAFVFSFPNLPVSQQVSPVASSATQATTLLGQSLAALTGQAALTDVTLSGIARRIAGSDDEAGTVTFRALATGETSINFSLPSGQRSEVHANSTNGPVGQWVGPDATPHTISQPNLMTESCWFFPAITLGRVLGNTEYVISYIGHETRNGQAVEHLSVSRQPQISGASVDWIATIRHLSQLDIFLDSTTLLPSAMLFNTHPDNASGVDIAIEIRFSDYQATSGLSVPMHLQKFVNNSLAFDVQIQSVTLNSGLAPSMFALQ